MVTVHIIVLLSYFLLQQISTSSTKIPPPPYDETTTGSSLSGELISDVEREYLDWVRHMDAYQSQLRKAEKKWDRNKDQLKKISCKKVIKVNNNRKNSKSEVFASVQEAVSSIPVFNKCRVVIYISAGTYKEKVEIPPTMGHITIRGKGADKTVIEWGDTAETLGKNLKPLGTYASATFAVNSLYFIAKNITFKNNAPPPPSGALGKQAVAMRVSGDKAAFVGCNFIGAQDTLYDHMGRHYFKDCYIEGSIDFVFGNGRSLYENCHLHAVTETYGALTAQKRESLLEETGFSFVKCKVTGASGVLYLGRAWGSFSRVVFAYTYMDKIITPKGWYDWGDKSRDTTVFYGQYKCWGPGAEYGGRVDWSRELTYEEAQPFISIDFIDGHEWLKESLYSH